MEHTANLAIQLLPLEKPSAEAYAIIDRAIETIRDSGLAYQVCPFETVIEGPVPELLALLERVRQSAFSGGADAVLINMKLHSSRSRDLRIHDKMHPYQSEA